MVIKDLSMMIKNEFSKKCQDLRINPAEASLSCGSCPLDLQIYNRLIVGLVLRYDFIMFILRDYGSFHDFGDRKNRFSEAPPPCFRENWRFITHALRKADESVFSV